MKIKNHAADLKILHNVTEKSKYIITIYDTANFKKIIDAIELVETCFIFTLLEKRTFVRGR